MLNKIWFALLLIGLVYGFGRAAFGPPGEVLKAAKDAPADGASVDSAAAPTRSDAMSAMGKDLTTAAIDAARTSVEICIGLIGIMALWLGLMKVAEQAGLIELLARGLRPVLHWLFPGIPRGHPAGGAIIMNFAANILGLDNAATPLGLKAMKELQTLNPVKDTATNSMAMFLAINTSSITLLPFSILGYRAAAGSKDPAAPIVAMTLATTCSTVTAIIACKFLQRFYPTPTGETPVPHGPAKSPVPQEEGDR